MTEIKDMFSAFTREQDKKLFVLQTSVDDIKAQNNEIVKSLDFLSSKYEELRGAVDSLEQDRKQNQIYINTLENKLEMLERKSRIACLEIRNVPKICNTETRQYLRDTVKKISSTLSVNVDDMDIRDVFRVNAGKEKDKPIVVDFNTAMKKEDFLRGFRTYNKFNKNNKFSTTQFGIQGVSRTVYMSEYLTSRAKKLHYLARDFAKSNSYDFCWTQNGSVFLRKKEGTPSIKIKCENDFPRTTKS